MEITESETDSNEQVVLPSFSFWAIIDDGKLGDEMYGINIIYGLCYNDLASILDSLKEDILNRISEDKFPLNCMVDFLATNVNYDKGQMDCPATGTWDSPPYWEMDIEVTKIQELSQDERRME